MREGEGEGEGEGWRGETYLLAADEQRIVQVSRDDVRVLCRAVRPLVVARPLLDLAELVDEKDADAARL